MSGFELAKELTDRTAFLLFRLLNALSTCVEDFAPGVDIQQTLIGFGAMVEFLVL